MAFDLIPSLRLAGDVFGAATINDIQKSRTRKTSYKEGQVTCALVCAVRLEILSDYQIAPHTQCLFATKFKEHGVK